jgi:hypothetical protein
MRVHFARSALILFPAVTNNSQEGTSEEVSQPAMGQRSAIENHQIDALTDVEAAAHPASPVPEFSKSNDLLTYRRNARFYSWRGRCYTQDQDENWYEVDIRLC